MTSRCQFCACHTSVSPKLVVNILFSLPVLLVHMCKVKLRNKPPFAVCAVQTLHQRIGLYLFCQTQPNHHHACKRTYTPYSLMLLMAWSDCQCHSTGLPCNLEDVFLDPSYTLERLRVTRLITSAFLHYSITIAIPLMLRCRTP